MTRFSKEFVVIDELFPFGFSMFSLSLFKIVTVVIVITIINYWLVIVFLVSFVLFVIVYKYFENPLITICKADS